MTVDTGSVVAGGALTVVILREVFAFLKSKKNGHTPNGREHVQVVSLLTAIQKDTEQIRANMHALNNIAAAQKTATDLLLREFDRRRDDG